MFRDRNVEYKAIEMDTKAGTVESGFSQNGQEYPIYPVGEIPNLVMRDKNGEK